jgi:hypothetical protein
MQNFRLSIADFRLKFSGKDSECKGEKWIWLEI